MYNEIWEPSKSDSLTHGNSEIYETINDGETWSRIWESKCSPDSECAVRPVPNDIFDDEAKGKIWNITNDDTVENGIYKSHDQQSLWWYQMPPTAVQETTHAILPENLIVQTIYPNPCDNYTTIQYSLRQEGIVKISVYDETGKLARTLYNGAQYAGGHTLLWFPPPALPSGAYMIVFESGEARVSKPILLTR